MRPPFVLSAINVWRCAVQIILALTVFVFAAPRAFAVAFMASQRNMSLMQAVTAYDCLISSGCSLLSLFPTYLLPQLRKPLARRMTRTSDRRHIARDLRRAEIGWLPGITRGRWMPIQCRRHTIVTNPIAEKAVAAPGLSPERDDAKFFLQFVENLFPIHYPAARQLAEALNVAAATAPLSVLDVGAGSGVWSVALAQQSDHVRVTAVDWPSVMAVTRKVAAQNALLDRYTFIAGDLLDVDFGCGHQIATLGHTLHSEGGERSRRLLKKCFGALAPGGTIAIAEILVDPERAMAVPALIFAENMVVNSDHSGTFSPEEITEWLGDTGFANVRTAEAPGPTPVFVLATKPSS